MTLNDLFKGICILTENNNAITQINDSFKGTTLWENVKHTAGAAVLSGGWLLSLETSDPPAYPDGRNCQVLGKGHTFAAYLLTNRMRYHFSTIFKKSSED